MPVFRKSSHLKRKLPQPIEPFSKYLFRLGDRLHECLFSPTIYKYISFTSSILKNTIYIYIYIYTFMIYTYYIGIHIQIIIYLLVKTYCAYIFRGFCWDTPTSNFQRCNEKPCPCAHAGHARTANRLQGLLCCLRLVGC